MRTPANTQDDNSIYEGGKQGKEASSLASVKLRAQLQSFIAPLLQQLDEQIDRRLVSNSGTTLQVILELHNSACGLLLSELGGYILTPDRAPAGTKRLSNLLRCAKWHYSLIEEFLWGKVHSRVEELEAQGVEVLVV